LAAHCKVKKESMNKKLTRQQRHIAYIIMREEAQAGHNYQTGINYFGMGFCEMYKLIFGQNDLYDDFKNTLPELYRKQPKEYYEW